jgi:phage replication O-like protein O
MKDNFTKIDNKFIEELIKIPFKGCEISIVLFLIRKIWGYHKEQDEISLTQIQSGVNRCRQTVVSSLKNLYLVNIVRLVHRGSMKNNGNIYTINRNVSTWNLVQPYHLVQRNAKPSLTKGINLVYTVRHTKDKQKKTKERTFLIPSLEELTAYCNERENNVDPQNFIDFYTAKGWMIGKNKIKDWKACVRTWERRDKDKPKIDKYQKIAEEYTNKYPTYSYFRFAKDYGDELAKKYVNFLRYD